MRSLKEMSKPYLVTAEELERFPDDDYRYELVEGRLIRMSPVCFDHGRIVARLIALLHGHLSGTPSGVVVTDVGFKLASNPDTVRGPDIAFLRNERLPRPGARGFVAGPPDAVFEVVSPDDRPGDVRSKVSQYIEKGVRVIVVIDPDERTITVFRPTSQPVLLRAQKEKEEQLDLDDAIPGFRTYLRQIFE